MTSYNTRAEDLGQPADAHKDGESLKSLHIHLTALELPEVAVEWLLQVFETIQFFDDVADKDVIDRKEFDASLWNSFVGFSLNPFFSANCQALVPVLSLAILKWQASDKAEQEGEADEMSFAWRASYYDIVLFVVYLCHGHEKATLLSKDVMQMYGEKMTNYRSEFNA